MQARAAIIQPNGGRGGLEKYTARLAKALLDQGVETTLLTKATPQLFDPRLSIQAISPWKWPAIVRMAQFDRFTKKALQQKSYQIVLGMDRSTNLTHYRAGNGVHAAYLEAKEAMHPGPFRFLRRFDPYHQMILSLEKATLFAPSLRWIFTNSEMVKQELLRFYDLPEKKIITVHNGVEWKELETPFEQGQKKENAPFTFLFLGHGYFRKGLHRLLPAFSRLPQETRLLVVGKEKKEAYFRQLADKLNLQSRISFLGEQKDPLPFYQQADALVIPSFYDPFANVTVEALAMGLFVVSSKHNGGHEVLTAENGAIIEDLQDEDSFVLALQKALSRPKTASSARAIRASVRHLDFSSQLSLQMPYLLESV